MAGSTLTRSLGRKLGSCCRTAIGPHFEARAVVDPRRPLFSSLSAESAAARGSVRVPRAEDRARCQGPSEVRHLAAPGRPRPPPACAQRVLPGPPSSQQPLGGTGTGKTPCPAAGPAPPAERALARERWREEGRSEPGRGGHQDAKPATAGSPLLSFPPGFGPEIETMAFRLRCRAWAAGPNGDTWGTQPGTGRALASRGSPAAFISQALRLASPRGPSGMCLWSGMWKPAARYTDVETRHQLARMLTLARRGPA